MEEPKAILHEFARQSKPSSNMIDPWQMQWLHKSLLVPPKFPYVTNCSPKPPTYSSIPLSSDIKHCILVIMLGGGISYLIMAAKLMQNRGYIYSVLFEFLDNSIVNLFKMVVLRCEVMVIARYCIAQFSRFWG
jgi:hypothetical protein